jgi:hypothetical protein
MPRGDGTGPLGNGPRTGRAGGPCAGRDEASFGAGRGWGRAFGGRFGRGLGRGLRNRFGGRGRFGWARRFDGPASAPAPQKQALEEQVKELESSLMLARRRVDEMQEDSSAG